MPSAPSARCGLRSRWRWVSSWPTPTTCCIVGRYSVTAKIGDGGMGEVYRTRDTKLDRDVALKDLQVSPSRHSVTVAVTPGPARRQV